MVNRPNNQQPKMAVSQQVMQPQQPRPPMIQPRAPIQQPGMANSISAMMRWLIIGVVVVFFCILALVAVAANFHRFTDGAGGLMTFIFQNASTALVIAAGLLAFKVFRKELLILAEWTKKTILYSGPEHALAKAKVKHVEATAKHIEAKADNSRLEALSQYEIALAQAKEKAARAWQLGHTLPVSPQFNSSVYVGDNGRPEMLIGPQPDLPAGIQTLHYQNAPRVTGISEEPQKQLEAAEEIKDIHIPTFGESMNAGLVGPGQGEILVCHALERDDTGALTGAMTPYQKPLKKTSTLLVGGTSGSGKTTLMLHLGLQGAMMDALYYIIDPHLEEKDESIAARMSALSHAFILPPAKSDLEVHSVLEHSKKELAARKDGKETLYTGRPIFLVIDEVLNLFRRAQRSESEAVIDLYCELADFMNELGTEGRKFGFAGIFATCYVTKDAFQIRKKGKVAIDWRDACQSQALLRLPANQAQAMRLLERDELRGARKLPTGHGYMGFMDGEVIRMASGNVLPADIALASQLVGAAPQSRRYTPGARLASDANGSTSDVTTQTTEVIDGSVTNAEFSPENTQKNTDRLETVNQPVELTPMDAEKTPNGRQKQFTGDQELRFITLYYEEGSIKKALAKMHLSQSDYQACARELLRRIDAK